MHEPIKFIYAAFAVALVGGAVTMYILKSVYATYTESNIAFAQSIDDITSGK